ncbi:MAG: DUF554 domain-containing protein [Spirochaetota bacterium]
MIATYINCLTVLIGSIVGLVFRTRIREDFRSVIFASAGIISLLVGLNMALATSSYLMILIAIAVGGMIGYLLDLEGAILRLGDSFERLTSRKKREDNKLKLETEKALEVDSRSFAKGFLDASILFCAGAMTIVGAIEAGTQGNYELILLKSIMDGFMAIMFTAAYGIGVAFSIITILVYQGGITLGSGWLAPRIGELGLNELSAVGGVLVLMIGFNLLRVKEFKTANFLPALVIILVLTSITPWVSGVYYSIVG